MIGFIKRLMAAGVIKGAKGYIYMHEERAYKVRLATAGAIDGVMCNFGGWVKQGQFLEDALIETENLLPLEYAKKFSHDAVQLGSKAKKIGEKPLMYAYMLVGTWLDAKVRNDQTCLQQHRAYFCQLLKGHEHMLDGSFAAKHSNKLEATFKHVEHLFAD